VNEFLKGATVLLHFTEKLRKKLRIPELTQVEVATGKHLRWYANLFTVQRVQYILTTNTAALFSVVIYGRGITDDADYIRQFLSELRDHLDNLELRLVYERVIAPRTGQITLAKTADRSVLGSMNDMVNQCKFELGRGEPSPWDLTLGLNETPFSAIGYQSPRQAFVQLPLEKDTER
jgi:Domain of unknown function (DUF6933)